MGENLTDLTIPSEIDSNLIEFNKSEVCFDVTTGPFA
jgi:hypothetical protein